MRPRKKLRWVKRRDARTSSWAAVPFDVIDSVVLTLIVALSIFVLRISYIYAAAQSPSKSAFQSFGESEGLGSAFSLGLILSAVLFVFWLVVTLSRIPKLKQSLALCVWHLFVFAGIGLLAYGCFIAVSF